MSPAREALRSPGLGRRSLWWLTAAIGGIVIGAQLLPLDSLVAALRTWVGDQGVIGMVSFGAVYTLAALLFVPGALLTVAAGGLFGLGWGVVVVAIATSCADAGAFLLARHVARDTIERALRRYPRFGALDRALTRGGWHIVALLRLSPTIPYSASNYFYGLTGIRFLPYFVTSGIFTLPGICAYVYLGHFGAETIGGEHHSTAEWALMAIGLAATMLATGYLAFLARRELARISVD